VGKKEKRASSHWQKKGKKKNEKLVADPRKALGGETEESFAAPFYCEEKGYLTSHQEKNKEKENSFRQGEGDYRENEDFCSIFWRAKGCTVKKKRCQALEKERSDLQVSRGNSISRRRKKGSCERSKGRWGGKKKSTRKRVLRATLSLPSFWGNCREGGVGTRGTVFRREEKGFASEEVDQGKKNILVP